MFGTMRASDACKNNRIHAIGGIENQLLSKGKAGKATHMEPASHTSSCVAKLVDPPIKPLFKPVDYVETLAEIHEELESAEEHEKSGLYLEQSFLFRGLGELKLMRRSLRSAYQHAVTSHERIVYASWLKYERRGEELDNKPLCDNRKAEFLRTATVSSCTFQPVDVCTRMPDADIHLEGCLMSRVSEDAVVFHIDGEQVYCNRQKMASLSSPFHAMLNGCFTESRTSDIEFSGNGISAPGLRLVEKFSKTGRLEQTTPNVVMEVLAFANRFFCEKMRDACDNYLAAMVHSLQDATVLIESGLVENAQALIAACLQVFLHELPGSLQVPQVARLFYDAEWRDKLRLAGHSSFALYSLLSHVAMEEDSSSDLSANLLEQMRGYAVSDRQKSLVLHQLGCVMLAKKHYAEAQELLLGAAQFGHAYSLAGVARVKYKCGQRQAAFTEATAIISGYKQCGWMFQERSLYCTGNEKLLDLDKATELDPTLPYPYKYRAALLMHEQKVPEAIVEINRILGFKVTPDCLELRIYFCLAIQDYAGAVRDLRALLTLDPSYAMYSGRVSATQLLELLSQHVDQWTKADCWMQLYDRWSSVDDIGSLAVVHQMLESDPGKGLLFFRQSLLLLRLNCPKAAMRSLRLAREHANSEHERLVYEGWILYDTGHRQEALLKAEESIALQRSFEAFFLKAYALADTSLDESSSAKVVELLEEALKCPSDGLRKGQALNNLGSVYVDCEKFELAADCYVSALKIRHTRAHQGLARVHFLQGDRKSAYEEMTKLIEKACNNATAYEKRSEYCDRDTIMADLNMVTQIDPLRTYPYRYRAAVAMDNHKEEEAIAELSKALAFKADLHVLHLRAAFYECTGDVPSALRDCRAALSVDPNHQDSLELRSRVHSRL
ncbi:hypothetical protein O6H91_09G044200 [Diphasiastrum complanatum]|uniref:Uncharacterized protein n=2 Tax=Diphasiastrum complanatum TaxID=34168 RepID=A0ACC2CNJ1_DIPCM|nr:hypothetical protein O6H91_09G044200 [Diphasiastrum complanatum]KAJ7543582.1 hypothetical protein O6H91_09G044200 [Diphasiastrum complanatum]